MQAQPARPRRRNGGCGLQHGVYEIGAEDGLDKECMLRNIVREIIEGAKHMHDEREDGGVAGEFMQAACTDGKCDGTEGRQEGEDGHQVQ